MPNPVLKHQITASLGEFGEFEQVSGGELDITNTDYYQAGARSPARIPGTYMYSDIVLSRAHDPNRDGAVVDWVNRYNAGLETGRQVIKITRNHIGFVIDQTTYAVCKPKGLKFPDGASGDNAVTDIQLTLAVEALL